MSEIISKPDIESTPADAPSAPEHEQEANNRRLPFFIFIATFMGTLLGIVADLSDASGLLVPILEFVDPSPQLMIAGSNTLLGEGIGVVAEWEADFIDQTKNTTRIPLLGTVERLANIDVAGVGSVRGLEMAQEGSVDLLVASEPMSSAQYEALTGAGVDIVCAAEVGYDIIAFVTDINNVLPQVSTRDMGSILNGNLTDWADVGGDPGPIRILARQGSGTTEVVLNSFTGSTEFRDHFLPCGSNDECLDASLSVPGSLYWVSAAWLQTQPPRYLRLILLQRGNLPPEDPLSEGFNPDNYTLELIRPLYMYVLDDGSSAESVQLARGFFDYARGVRGQAILENHNFYTHFDPPAAVAAPLPPGFGPDTNGLPVVCKQ